MARFFPSSLESESPTPGEERVFAALKRGLPEDAWGWFEALLRSRKGSRRPDFVVLSPEFGLLVLEVKDWSPSGIVEGAARYVVGERLDCSGMRWIPERAEALFHLRCIELTGLNLRSQNQHRDDPDQQRRCL